MRRSAAAFAFYLVLSLIVLYNPLFHMATHVPGDETQATDYYHYHWNYWWIRHALATGHTIYLTDYVFAPFTSNLAYHVPTPIFYPVWALLEPITGTVPAMTAVLALEFTLTGWTFYLLLRRERVKAWLTLSFGAILQFSPLMINSLYWTNINTMGLFWIPTLILLWGEAARHRWTWALIFGVALYGVIMTDPQWLVLSAPIVIPYGVLTLIRSKQPIRLIGRGVLALGIMLILWYFAGSLPYMLMYDRSTLSPTPLERAVEIPFPQGYFSRIYQIASLGALPIPLIVLALLITWINRKRLRGGFWLLLVPLPLILIGGWFPYPLLHTFFNGLFRYPERFAPALIVAGLIFAGKTFSQYKIRAWMGIALLLLVVGEARIFSPQPIQPLPPSYQFHADMGREPYEYVIVDVPTGGGSGEGIVGNPRWLITQFYALTHGKKVINGHFSRTNTWYYMNMETADPLLAWLGGRRPLDTALVEAELRDRIYSNPIGYFVIHTDLIERNTATLQEIIGYFNQLDALLCPYTVEGDAIVYRTAWHPNDCPDRTPPETEPGVYEIDIGAPDDARYIGWGYHWAESIAGLTLRWTGEYPQTTTYVDLSPASYEVTVNMQSFWEDRHMTLEVNGTPIGDPVIVGTRGLADYSWLVPAEIIDAGRHVAFTLRSDAVVVPSEVGQSSDPRRLAVAIDYFRLRRL